MIGGFAVDNPFLERLGVRITEWAPGRVEMTLAVEPSLGNRTGRVQGGVLCTLLDAVAGYAGLYAPPGAPAAHSLTLSLTTNFIDSAPGRLLIARGVVERQGRSIYFARGEVWMDGEVLLATAVGTFKIGGRGRGEDRIRPGSPGEPSTLTLSPEPAPSVVLLPEPPE